MRRVPREEQDDQGFTLLELLVVGALMSLISILVSTTVIGGMRTSARAEKRTDDVSAAQRVVSRISSDVRAAIVYEQASRQKLTVLTRTDLPDGATPVSDPVRVTYEVDATGVLSRTVTTGTYDADAETFTATGTPLTTPLMPGVVSSARPLFTFLGVLDTRRQCATGATTSTIADATGTVADPRLVYSLEVWLSAQSAPHLGGRPATVTGGAVSLSRGQLDLGTTTSAAAGIGTGCT